MIINPNLLLYYYYVTRECNDNGVFTSGGWYNRGVSGTYPEFCLSGDSLWFNRIDLYKTPHEGGETGFGGGGGGEINDRADEQITQPNNHPTKKGINLLACPFPEE